MHNVVYEEGELDEEVERYINYQIILERETPKEMPVFHILTLQSRIQLRARTTSAHKRAVSLHS